MQDSSTKEYCREKQIPHRATAESAAELIRGLPLADRHLSEERRKWWKAQRLHGLCAAFRQECAGRELKSLSDRLKTPGGIQTLKRLLLAAIPKEYRSAG